jgi:hypothetical protein
MSAALSQTFDALARAFECDRLARQGRRLPERRRIKVAATKRRRSKEAERFGDQETS